MNLPHILVLGIGNLLLGDEGVGIHAVRELEQTGTPPTGVEITEVGTAILDALPALERADKVVVLDAVKACGEPGSVYRIPIDRCSASRHIASMHGFDIFRVLSLAGRKAPPEVVVLGIEPAFIGWSLELSASVARALPALIMGVYQEYRSYGYVSCSSGQNHRNRRLPGGCGSRGRAAGGQLPVDCRSENG